MKSGLRHRRVEGHTKITGFRGRSRKLAGSACLHELSCSTAKTDKLSPVLSRQASTPLEALKIVERVKGIEPSLSAWKADNGLRAGREISVSEFVGLVKLRIQNEVVDFNFGFDVATFVPDFEFYFCCAAFSVCW